MHIGVAIIDRDLCIDHAAFGLQYGDIVKEALILIFIEI